ncbi:uncharacterized protein LOC131995081 [Stomoxys calcitrans]|uniref:uncharacterized protein LOC131995081 n=1 Tax=Stomoxys calcitrans TaxID=35570 RepID=UPI0027E22A65|nr:uncharacterized protein LOC131995081 [Stomoxys calcitrans]
MSIVAWGGLIYAPSFQPNNQTLHWILTYKFVVLDVTKITQIPITRPTFLNPMAASCTYRIDTVESFIGKAAASLLQKPDLPRSDQSNGSRLYLPDWSDVVYHRQGLAPQCTTHCYNNNQTFLDLDTQQNQANE